ncbi:1767_t:CDS:2, partial [Scutellospora calospora]
NGAFVYRHIFMDEFEKEFNVKPIHFSIIDPDIEDLLAKHNIRSKLLNYTKNNLASIALMDSDNWSPIIENIKNEVENGTYVDDRRVYVRWVNDFVRWGMFANRNFQANELLGIYTGFITRTLHDFEYAWEFNYIVDVVDDNGEKVRVCIDGKHMGNYMRFANHHD